MIARLVETLATRVRTLPSGARSLAHLCVIVPTSQSGRRLRQRLAARFGALVPPEVRTPRTRYLASDDPTLASRTDVIAAFRTACAARGAQALSLARELADLRLLLEPGALSFSDVAAVSEDPQWQDLRTVEERYLAELEKRGKVDRIAALKKARAETGERSPFEEVLDWSDPRCVTASGQLALDRIVPCATPSDEAARIADYFAQVKPDEAWPALCVADPELFPEIETAFKARGLKIHNPAETKLSTSSLGHLVVQIIELLSTRSYSVFSAFVRGGDVRRWLKRELKLTDAALTEALADLDNRQAEYLPERIDDIAPHTQGTLRAIFEFVKTQLRKKTLRQVLGAIFKDVVLDERDAGAREFAAAAEVVSQLIAECGDDRELFALRLDEATYSLEPDEGEIILTDGWMELPFLETDELVIAGFQEGCVPESTVGHPYLPDSLRQRLGLPDNALKEARDRAILRLAVGSRDPAKVRVFFHAIDAKGDALKPSRLLFETPDDRDLFARVDRLYGTKAGTTSAPPRDLPRQWKLALPIPPDHQEVRRISPTRLDTYLSCPFTYYLRDKTILGDKRLDDRAEELASWEYGNLAHEALESFGLSALKDSTDSAAIRDFLEEKVDEQLVARFGTAIPAIVAMQGESVKRRLANFSAIQAKRRAEGWQIVAVERNLEVAYGKTRIYGKCDRIDYNPSTGKWCVIDYKTYDATDKAISVKTGKGDNETWVSVQLPLYCAMLTVAKDEDLKGVTLETVSACYCVLGKTEENVVFSAPMEGSRVRDAEPLVRLLIRRIEHGIFWPPNPLKNLWRFDYEDWLDPSPEQSVSEDWISDQMRRLDAFENGDSHE